MRATTTLLLAVLMTGCSLDLEAISIRPTDVDGGPQDSGPSDGGKDANMPSDAGSGDAGMDATMSDDGGPEDGGPDAAMPVDAGPIDAGVDAGPIDAGVDAGTPLDAGTDACTLRTYYLDNDGDGYGSPLMTMPACASPSGYVAVGGDCDDSDPTDYDGVTSCATTIVTQTCNHDGLGYTTIVCEAGQSCLAGACAVRCGDGIVGMGETCDDGNTRDGDGCSSTCAGASPVCTAFTGSYAAPISLGTGSEIMGVFIRDMNGDGHLDVFAVDQIASRVVLYAGNGLGGFAAGANTPTGRNHGNAAFADFNGDGVTDVVLSEPDAGALYRVSGSASGLVGLGSISQASSPRASTTLDYDHDGDQDLLVYLGGSGCVAVRLNDGSFNLAAASCVLTVPMTPYTAVMTSLDWDGDGYRDLVLAANSGPAIVYRTTGTGLVELVRFGTIATRMRSLDINGDGNLDLLLEENLGQVFGYLFPTGAPLCTGIASPAGGAAGGRSVPRAIYT